MNLDHYLHTHIEARYDWEPVENKCRPTWFYLQELRYSEQYEYTDEKFGELRDKIREALFRLMEKNGMIHNNGGRFRVRRLFFIGYFRLYVKPFR